MKCLNVGLTNNVFCAGLPNEYCQEDYYDTQCADNQVILMKFADYGRMRIGKCVKDNYGHLGCSSDVTPVMNALCSGRQKCRFQVFDYDNRLSSSQCPDDIESYLQASHTCQEGKKQFRFQQKCIVVLCISDNISQVVQ